MYSRWHRNERPPECIETQRLIVRRFTVDDAPMMFEVAKRNRKHLQRYESSHALYKAYTLEHVIVGLGIGYWQMQSSFEFGAFEKQSGDFVCQAQLFEVDNAVPSYSIGYYADVDHVGQGYVTETVKALLVYGFDHLQAHRISIDCDDTNVRSKSVAERCHFTYEGHARENTWNNDRTISGRYYFGMLRYDFDVIRHSDPQFQVTVKGETQ